jgi:ATP-binding cassette subfamily C (CFTR/MRP) protein 1
LSTNPRVRTHISVASAALSFASGLSLGLLSHLEHSKSIRPSFLINLFLISTVLLDIARVRTQWLIGADDGVAGALTASLAVKCVLLVLEAAEKRSLLLGLDRTFSRESTSGLISRSAFWWLNSLLLSGFNAVFTLDDLPNITEKLDSETLANQLQSEWDKCEYFPGQLRP